MTDFRKGDVCSLEVVVVDGPDMDGEVHVAYTGPFSGRQLGYVAPSALTLIRRAPVDLATCEIPQEGLLVRAGSGDLVTMVGRDGDMAWLRYDMQSYDSRLVSDLRPPDVPTPATGAPGHIMIGDRAVPEPMKKHPRDGDTYWFPVIDDDGEAGALSDLWDNAFIDHTLFMLGGCHRTEANARAHAEAIIALSAGEGV
ncbi:hypothetical protein ACFONL_16090 [Camelimonas fluminis]|uniref:Uncharacterized protein n=1 Tax=Camelimonas fluminis TaxID=1576911 RepID=A0ABV7UJG1_9HYPH